MILRFISVCLFGLCLIGCAITRPVFDELAVKQLTPCPWTPNCVSTEASKEAQRVAPFVLAVDAQEAWPKLLEVLSAMDGVTIEEEQAGYVYAKFHSRVFKFVDYFEVLLVDDRQRLAVRSASRLGISDLGVNRQRVENFRKALQARALTH